MQNLALDTNAYMALGKGNKVLASLVSKAVHIGLPIIVLGEIYFGSLNGNQNSTNTEILERFLSSSRVEILNIDGATAKTYGEIATQLRKIGRPVQQNDIWIAALCKQYGYKLATNDAGFQGVLGLDVVSF